MNLRELPAGELPRERLIEHGAAALSDAELLAILQGRMCSILHVGLSRASVRWDSPRS